MLFSFEILLFFALLSLGASVVNGGLGYGYSSVSTPLAILVLINRIVNPAYVLLEAFLNTVMLFLSGRKLISVTLRRTLPIILSVVPGVILGSLLLSQIAPAWVRFIVYATILPLILLQAAGIRRPIEKRESVAGVPLGFGVGLLYSITTISGPPIALFWNNQGMKKEEFKASIAQIRIAESYLTCLSYYFLGLFTLPSLQLFSVISPPVLLGIPLGIYVVKKLPVETFRRICMGFDSLIVGFGLSQVLISLLQIPEVLAYGLLALVILLDAILLYRYFAHPAEKAEIAIGIPARANPDPSAGKNVALRS